MPTSSGVTAASPYTQALVSAVIIATLSLQALASFDLYPRLTSRPSWLFYPFLNYPMYSRAHYEGERVPRYVVVGTLDDGVAVQLSPRDLGLTFFMFHRGVVGALLSNRPERLQPYAEMYLRRRGQRLISVRLETHGPILMRQGTVSAPPTVSPTINLFHSWPTAP